MFVLMAIRTERWLFAEIPPSCLVSKGTRYQERSHHRVVTKGTRREATTRVVTTNQYYFKVQLTDVLSQLSDAIMNYRVTS